MVKWVLDNFVIPNGEITSAWYMWVAGSIVCFWLFFWWTVGVFSTTVFGAGFARAEDVKSIEIRLVENSIIEYKASQCSGRTNQVRQFYAELMQQRMRSYEKLASHSFQLPDCSDLVEPAGPTNDPVLRF